MFGLVLVWIANALTVVVFLILFVMYVILAAFMLLIGSAEGLMLAGRSAVGIDQAANALLGGNEDQTMSGRMGRRIENGKATKFELWLCNILSKIDPYTERHCVESIEHDERDISKKG